MRKEGAKIIIEPVAHPGLLALLASFSPMADQFPDVDKSLTKLDDIEL
jgi:virulence-associated protein VagC